MDWWEFGTPALCRPLVISFVDLVEIFHGGEGGDVERWLEPRNESFVFAFDFFATLYCFTFLLVIYLVCTSLLHPFNLLAFFGLYSSQ